MGKGRVVKKAILFVNLHKKNAFVAARQVSDEFTKQGIETCVFAFDGKPENVPQGQWDIAVSLGGDGTVLFTARCLASLNVPILPVNLGSLGFIAGKWDDWLDVFTKWKNGEISPSQRCMLEVSVERSSEIVMKNICLNDIVISASGIAKLIKLDVFIGSKSLVSYRCDGLIISTPTGSTAYSMAAGGPIVDPEMEALIINPICPFALSNRPFVLPSKQPLVISVPAKQRTGVLLTVDGQDTFNLECGDNIFIQQAKEPAMLVFSDRHAYYAALRNKLLWPGDSVKGGKHA